MRPLSRLVCLTVVAATLVGLTVDRPAPAETCLSPFVKRLDRPEKFLYVFCLDADEKDNDSLVTIDVAKGSKTYGKVVHQLDLGSKGNETHHFGYTDDRTHIWGCSLFTNQLFIINVADNPARPKLVKMIDSAKASGFTGPHSPHALPGRMLISFLGGKDGGLPTGLAEFNNDGTFIRSIPMPKDAPYGYDVALNVDRNRMVTSSFTYPNNYRKPLNKMDMKQFGNKLVVWDFRGRKPLQTLEAGAAPLECRWSLTKGANHGFTNCALEDSVWVWEPKGEGYATRKLFDTGKLPVDLRMSADGKYLFVSCFFSNDVQMWDVSDLKKPTLVSKVSPGVQPNMMHLSGDGKRMYVSNSLLSTIDQKHDDFWVKLIHVTPKGMMVDKDFKVDLTKFKSGPTRGHDMLLN